MSIIDRIRGIKKTKQQVFHPEQEIKTPTLLIDAKFNSHSKLLFFCNLITLGIFRLRNRILPVECPIGLKLYFKNLYKTKIKGQRNVPFFIVEPGSDQISNLNGQFKETTPNNNKMVAELHAVIREPPQRGRELNLPMVEKNEHVHADVRIFFRPEIPGTHEFIFTPSEDFQYAGYYGLTDRKYKLINGSWTTSFHVSSHAEFRTIIIIIFTLCVALITLIITILNLFISSGISLHF